MPWLHAWGASVVSAVAAADVDAGHEEHGTADDGVTSKPYCRIYAHKQAD